MYHSFIHPYIRTCTLITVKKTAIENLAEDSGLLETAVDITGQISANVLPEVDR